MSTATSRWALAWFCISGLSAGNGSLAAPPPSPAEEALELELEAAQGADLYLVVDPAAGTLEVRIRGVVLDSASLDGAALFGYRPVLGEAAAPAVRLPAAWTIQEEADAPHRRHLSPADLEPWSEARAAERRRSVAVGSEKTRLPPADYQAGLDRGWRLRVAGELPAAGFWSRLPQVLHHGWGRLWSREAPSPGLVALSTDPETARRLHHLFRPGVRLLILSADGEGVR